MGKTTLGQALAKEFGWDFCDLDQEWERRQGQSILSFVEQNGLEAFRREEAKLLEEFEANPPQRPTLVATGGGVVDADASFQLLSGSKHPKILIAAEAKTLWDRLEPLAERRKIGDLSNFSRMEELLRKRQPRFEKIASYTVENRDITQALSELRGLLMRLWQDVP